MFDTWANQTENVDYRRAASCYIARFQGKPDMLDGHVADAATDGRMAELIHTTARCFLGVMPEQNSTGSRNRRHMRVSKLCLGDACRYAGHR